jgi:hypothetical protein
MNRRALFAIALLTAALTATWAAPMSPARTTEHGLRVQLVLPVSFGPFPGCADGASYAIRGDDLAGTGTTCLLTFPDFSPCAEGTGFCRDLATHSVLNLGRRGTIQFDANQHEVVTAFDPATFAFSVDITWNGSVTVGTGKFRRLAGALVTGGGSTAFAADGTQTGKLAFVIGERPEKD